ncbi:Holliday junction branch migration protein RuvA [Patescibacteria group bacterium]|nr:Holliday junction branch migration protein RuvA [Patescibacteria group bacterium]
MISHLTGKIIHADTRFFIIDVNGVGYKIFTTAGVLEKLLPETVSFWTYLAVREDALDLYGFPTKDEMDFFELLLTVNGIGPKTALGILNVANPATIRKAVATEDPSYLTKVSGIGKKNAEKIVLELKSKLTGWEATEGEEAHTAYESDALEALKSLGYSERDARDALKKVPKEITNTSECVRHALKMLGSK